MKNVLILIAVIFISAPIWSQTHKSRDSKHTTIVDSAGAPPRMDGNTGQYDTVKHPPKSRGPKRSNKKPATVDYNINKEKITTQPAR